MYAMGLPAESSSGNISNPSKTSRWYSQSWRLADSKDTSDFADYVREGTNRDVQIEGDRRRDPEMDGYVYETADLASGSESGRIDKRRYLPTVQDLSGSIHQGLRRSGNYGKYI